MIDLGTVRPGSTIRIPFSSFDKDDGSSITMTNYAAADILIYKDGSTTERASTAGFTATTDFDSKTGKHVAVIDLADDTTADFYKAGSEYLVAIDAVTVDTVTTGGWIARFRIGYPNAYFDTSIATLASQTSFTLTAGPAEDDALNGMVLLVHDKASAVQVTRVVVEDYTGSTKTVTLRAAPATTFTIAAGDNVSAVGFDAINVTHFGGSAGTFASGRPEVNTTHLAGTAYGSADFSATMKASINTEADTAASDYGALKPTVAGRTANVDASGRVLADVDTIKTNPVVNAGTVTFPTAATLASTTNITAGTITTATNVTTVNGLAANVITAASIAADAITAAKIATDAIDSDAIAASAVTEIQSGLATAAALATVQADTDDIQSRLPAALTAGGNIKADALAFGGATVTATTSVTIPAASTLATTTGAVGSVTGNVGGNVTGSVGSLAAQAKADVNTEVLDVLNVDTFAEPGQEAPAATNTLVKKIGYLFKLLRNKITQTSTTLSVFDDAGTTVDQKATISDDGTTYTRGEIGTGP